VAQMRTCELEASTPDTPSNVILCDKGKSEKGNSMDKEHFQGLATSCNVPLNNFNQQVGGSSPLVSSLHFYSGEHKG
jgi:hypothetical protein